MKAAQEPSAFIPVEIVAVHKQENILNNRRDLLLGDTGSKLLAGPATSSGSQSAVPSKRKANKIVGGFPGQTHGMAGQSSLAKSLKDHATIHDPSSIFPATNLERNAQTSIDWKNSKKRGLGLAVHNSSHQRAIELKKQDRTVEIDVFQDNNALNTAPKTQSSRPNGKKLAGQTIVDRIAKGSTIQGPVLQ